MGISLPEKGMKMRGARLKHEGLEIPCLYVEMDETALDTRPRVLIFRDVLSPEEAAIIQIEDNPNWDYSMIAGDDIEMSLVFPSDDTAIYGFRSFLWACPERATVTVRPDSFRTVLESFKLDIFKKFDIEHIHQPASFRGNVPYQEMEYSGVRIFIDNRHIFVHKPNDWRGQFPTPDSQAVTPRARYDSPMGTVLLHEDWTMEIVENKKGG